MNSVLAVIKHLYPDRLSENMKDAKFAQSTMFKNITYADQKVLLK